MAIKGDLFMDVIDLSDNLGDMIYVSKKLKSVYIGNPVFLGLAFSDNPIIQDDIDKAYSGIEDIALYMNNYASDITYDAISSFNIERQQSIYKTCAILSYCLDVEDFTILNKIIKKGYKRIYKHLLNADGVTDLEVDSIHTNRLEMSTLNDLKIYSLEIVAAYFCYFNNKEFLLTSNSLYSWSLHIIHSLLVNRREIINIKANKDLPFNMDIMMSSKFRGEESRYLTDSLDDKKYSKENIDKLYNKYGVSKTFLTVDMIMSEYRHSLIEDVYGKDCDIMWNYMQIVAEFDKSDEILRTYDFMMGCLRLGGLYPLAFMVQPLERAEITFCLLGLDDFRKAHKLSVTETKKLLPHMLILYCLGKQYKKASKLSVIDDLENKALQITKLRDEYQNKLNEVNNKAQEYEDRCDKLESRLKNTEIELLRRITELEKENSKLKEELVDYDIVKKEVASLREKVYYDEMYKEDEDENIEDMTSYLRDRTITVIGGNPQWVNKLSNELPNIKFIEFKSIGNYLATIRKAGKIYLNVEYFNHPSYYKLMNSLSNAKVKIVYLSGYSNIQRTIRELYNYETK